MKSALFFGKAGVLKARMARLYAVLLGTAALSGCAMLASVPDLDDRRPDIEIPSAWNEAKAKTGVSGDVKAPVLNTEELARWWQRLGDPLLDALVEYGLKSAPDMRVARLRLQQARANRDLTASGVFPTLNASVGATRSSNGDNPSTTLYNAGFDASWEPDIFGGTRYAISGAESDLAAYEARLEQAKVTLAAEITRNYVEYRTYQERLDIARKNAASQEEILNIARWRVEAGLTGSLDAEQAQVALEQARASLPALENARVSSLYRLDVLLGLTPGRLRALHPELADIQSLSVSPRVPEEIALDIPSGALYHRPDVRVAERVLRAETDRLRGKAAERFPSLRLAGRFGWQDASFSALGGSAAIVRSLTAALSAALFDGARIQSQITAQDAVVGQALTSYEQTLLAAMTDVEVALLAYSTGKEQAVSRKRALLSARNAALMASQMYQSGLADFQKVLDTQRTLLSSEDALVAAQSDLLVAVIQLYKALGGGWEPEAVGLPSTEEFPGHASP